MTKKAAEDGSVTITLSHSKRQIKWREPLGRDVKTIMGMASTGGIGSAICAGVWLLSIAEGSIAALTEADFDMLSASDAMQAVNAMVESFEFFRELSQGGPT